MTLGFLEDCPDCGHTGGRPIAVRTDSVVGMQCPECESYYDMSIHKETRPNHD
jgi:hypothetical protein